MFVSKCEFSPSPMHEIYTGLDLIIQGKRRSLEKERNANLILNPPVISFSLGRGQGASTYIRYRAQPGDIIVSKFKNEIFHSTGLLIRVLTCWNFYEIPTCNQRVPYQ